MSTRNQKLRTVLRSVPFDILEEEMRRRHTIHQRRCQVPERHIETYDRVLEGMAKDYPRLSTVMILDGRGRAADEARVVLYRRLYAEGIPRPLIAALCGHTRQRVNQHLLKLEKEMQTA